jgi:hypothetical protein
VFAVSVSLGSVLFANQQAPAQPVPATPQNAASFVGEWNISANEASTVLTVKVEAGKLAGELNGASGTNRTALSIAGTSLVATYTFDYEGMSIDGVVTLTPNDREKRVDAVLDFADGAAQFTGTATKK